MIESWFKVNCQARITNMEVDFYKGIMTVTGYIDFEGFGHDGTDGLLSKEFKHSWSTFGKEFDILAEILTKKCGNDLMGPEQTMKTLQKEKFDD